MQGIRLTVGSYDWPVSLHLLTIAEKRRKRSLPWTKICDPVTCTMIRFCLCAACKCPVKQTHEQGVRLTTYAGLSIFAPAWLSSSKCANLLLRPLVKKVALRQLSLTSSSVPNDKSLLPIRVCELANCTYYTNVRYKTDL